MRSAGYIATAIMLIQMAATTQGNEPEGPLVLPNGFRATLFADDDLATNIYAMTLDSMGRVTVSGPGYVKILEDDDGDQRADRAIQFSDRPASGAQGLCWDGPDLLFVGDGGIHRLRDANGDGRADGAPEKLLALKTGGEHDVHAIRRGPDGWWYLTAGNYSGVDEQFAKGVASPIRRPEAGVFFRVSPDFSASEIISHGLRNSYDYAFNELGDAFTYDSDGERDVTLPWYRPTRVFHLVEGSHAGWITRSWKRPSYSPDLSPVLGSFGRGSPTGVTCYRHNQFPKRYHGGIFALDWTYGRVLFVPLKNSGAGYQRDGGRETFISARGGFGFAPTDCEVAPDGSLIISVGGRGTRGGVYRISYASSSPVVATPAPGAEDASQNSLVHRALGGPQPLSSWARG